jgi:hypothetical protein
LASANLEASQPQSESRVLLAGVAAGELVATWLIAEPAHSAATSANPITAARLFILMSFIGRTLYTSRVIMPRVISSNFAIRAALSPGRLSML